MSNQTIVNNVPVTFIKEAYEAACSTWKKRLEDQFPEILKEKPIKQGVWYRYTDSDNHLVMFTDPIKGKGYGIGMFGWIQESVWSLQKLEKASHDFILERLTEVAIEKGYKAGVTVDRDIPTNFVNRGKVTLETNRTSLFFDINKGLQMGGWAIMEDGVWAPILPPEDKDKIELKESIARMEKELEEMKKKLDK